MTTAQDRGWGPAYPNHCAEARANCVEAEVAGCVFLVHYRVASLLAAFAAAWHRTVEPLDPAQCWSFACRAIRGGITASNHSWGLALDLNSAKHPLGSVGTFSPSQQRAIRSLLARPEFQHVTWGGDYASRKDEMHVEFTGTPAQAVADTRLLSGTTEEDDVDEATLERVLRKVINEVFTAPGSNGAADSVDDDRTKINAVLADLTEIKGTLGSGTTSANGGLPATFTATFTRSG